MPDHSKIRKVSLEEVLRLKRLERPELAFWDQFEKQLREKQLAAIVAKRPWWQLDFGRVMAGVARARVPVGAAAVLTLTFLVVREYREVQRVVTYLRWSEGDADALAPSLWAKSGATRRKKDEGDAKKEEGEGT